MTYSPFGQSPQCCYTPSNRRYVPLMSSERAQGGMIQSLSLSRWDDFGYYYLLPRDRRLLEIPLPSIPTPTAAGQLSTVLVLADQHSAPLDSVEPVNGDTPILPSLELDDRKITLPLPRQMNFMEMWWLSVPFAVALCLVLSWLSTVDEDVNIHESAIMRVSLRMCLPSSHASGRVSSHDLTIWPLSFVQGIQCARVAPLLVWQN